MSRRRDLLRQGSALAALAGLGGAVLAERVEAAPVDPFNPPYPLAWALLLLDRSGSMRPTRDAVIEGINLWLDDRRREDRMMVAIMMFDHWQAKFRAEMLIDWTPSHALQALAPQDFVPQGETPLREAVLHGADVLAARVRPQDRGLMVTHTDGRDTHSAAETSLDVVLGALADLEARGNFTFAHLGAGPEGWSSVTDLVQHDWGSWGYGHMDMTAPAGAVNAFTVLSTSTSQWYQSPFTASPNFYMGAVTYPTTITAANTNTLY